jgi:hypothetical protein
MAKRLTIVAFIACVSYVGAAPLQFPEHNFSIELPAAWVDITPKPPEVLIASQSPDNARRMLIFAIKMPDNERGTAAADFRAGVKDSMIKQGWRIEPERQLTINGQPFISFASHSPSGTTLTAYTTASGGEVYMLQAMNGDTSVSDPDLQSIVQSFRLLSQAETQPLNTRSRSAAYRAGYIFGRILFIVIIATIIGLIVRARFKREVA